MILKKLIKCALQRDQKELPISDIDTYILHLTWPILLKVGSVEIGVKPKQNQIIRTKAFPYHTSSISSCHANRLNIHNIKYLFLVIKSRNI